MSAEKRDVNSVDLATQQIRQLQQMFFRHDVTAQDLFNFTNKILDTMADASKEINTNYKEISEKLTKHMNTGRPQE
jgi:hypothetical protein